MRSTLASLTLALLCACNPATRADGSGDVYLDVAPSPVDAGATVDLTLGNRSGGDIGFNLCNSGLQRLDGDTWQNVPDERVCTMELRTLEAGAETRYPYELPDGMAPGRYRINTSIERLGTGERNRVYSHTFVVRS